MADADLWQRSDAEREIHEVFEKAKTRGTQTIQDELGQFEIRYIAPDVRPTASQVLSRGGPGEE